MAMAVVGRGRMKGDGGIRFGSVESVWRDEVSRSEMYEGLWRDSVWDL